MSDDTLPTIISYSADIADAEAPDPLPASDYPAVIEAAERKTSANTGNDYVSVTFRIATDNFPADYDVANAPDGKVLTYNRLSPEDNIKARWGMKKFCAAIGAPGGRDLNLLEWVGLTAILQLGHKEWEGVIQEEIKVVKPA